MDFIHTLVKTAISIHLKNMLISRRPMGYPPPPLSPSLQRNLKHIVFQPVGVKAADVPGRGVSDMSDDSDGE